MQNKVSVNTNIGMLRDRSISKVDNQFAFENHNIRITARDKDTLLSVTNERGNAPITIIPDNTSTKEGIGVSDISGTLLGYSVLNNYIVLFTTEGSNTDRIYRIEYDAAKDKWYGKILYQGDLSFDIEHPIETIPLYETDDIQKVYWVDGINQPRFINIKKEYYDIVNNSPVYSKNTVFDFVTDFNHSGDKTLSMSVEKQHLGIGSFPAGTIQYLCTYFNKYGQETNIVETTSVNYVSPKGRGGSPEETVTCSFKITIENPDTDFDFVRVYALLRTSESGTPISYIVGDIAITNSTISIIDSGQGDNVVIDPTILLYVGGREVTAGTFSHKDNTLFLGDLTVKTSKNDEVIQGVINNIYTSLYNPEDSTAPFISKVVHFTQQLYTDTDTPYYQKEGLYPYESQLDYPLSTIAGFKGGEKYRFGLQFISSTGQKSKIFFLGDCVNPYYPAYDENKCAIERAIPEVYLPQALTQAAYSVGYRQAVLMMAEPSDGDRSIVAQGIISPTVYNLSQRVANAPYAISSWYLRPRNCNMNSRHYESVNNVDSIVYEGEDIREAGVVFSEIQNIEPFKTPYFDDTSFDARLIQYALVFWHYGRAHEAMSMIFLIEQGGSAQWHMKNDVNSVVVSGFPTSGPFSSAHWTELKKEKYRVVDRKNVKQKHIENALKATGIDESLFPSYEAMAAAVIRGEDFTYLCSVDIMYSTTGRYYAAQNSEQYFIDENIVTFNTPDIDKLISTSVEDLKFRIVGVAEGTSNITDYTLQTTTGRALSQAVYQTSFSHSDGYGFEGLMTYPLLYDLGFIKENSVFDAMWPEFIAQVAAARGIKPEDVYSAKGGLPFYFDIFPFHKEGSVIASDDIQLQYKDDESVDTTSTFDYSKIEKKIEANLRYCYTTKFKWTGNSAWKPKSDTNSNYKERTKIVAVAGDDSAQYKQIAQNNKNYIYQGTYDYLSSSSKKYGIYVYSPSDSLDEETVKGTNHMCLMTTDEPVRVQFKANPHVVIKFGRYNGKNEILPILNGETFTTVPTGSQLPWEDDVIGVYQELEVNYRTDKPYYFIGELYKDFSDGDDRYGGTTEYALKNNTFIAICDRATISPNSGLKLVGTDGDTFFQRWDCIKTEPYSNESKNGIVDITSFLVETHTNIDGRYDVRRGLTQNVTTSEVNANKINRVYSNLGNFFAGKILDAKYDLSAFPNQITWSKTKTYGEDVDTWSNMTMASVLDFDGDKGRIRAIRRFNNSLIAFQDRGIAEILFNSRTQLSTTTGVPIEIGNSGKVEGKRYISEKAGCLNKWSIVETKSGIYFIDNINKNISVIGQGIQELSSAKGFDAWVKSYNSVDTWNPRDFNNFVGFYDSTHGDVYFIRQHQTAFNNDSCLVFNEYIGQFTSFFDYIDVPMMVNVKDRFVSFKNTSSADLWLQNEGQYNNIYGVNYPYWITYRICPDPYGDKTFNNIEYRADIIRRTTADDVIEYPDKLITNKTFDGLRVWNEYQEGEVDLKYELFKMSDVKKKFRIWRANIPRDSKDPRGLNRIRNPWAFIQLKKDKELADERMEFHDLMVKYYE